MIRFPWSMQASSPRSAAAWPRKILFAVLGIASLVACANLAPCRSLYRWRGRIADETEVQIALKTTASRASDAEHRLREIHPYETPAILRLAVQADPAYASWVADSVGATPADGIELS